MRVLLLALLLLMPQSTSAKSSAVRVAILISGFQEHGDPSISYDLEELAQSYLILTQNSVVVDIVTPQGGKVRVKNNKDDLDFIQEFKQNTPALNLLKNTLSAKLASQKDYQAIFIVGGDGAMFDLPFEPNTQSFIQSFVDRNLPIAAVCHGPAALVNLTLTNGDYFVKDKEINSFTLREEQAFSQSLIDKFPFMLETELIARGAVFKSNAPMLPFVAEHGNLITAQNPMSVPRAAEALLIKLGIVPKAREAFKDEATMHLISQARHEGSYILDAALASSPDKYNKDYLALYGFYAYQMAQGERDKLIELDIMARLAKYINHPQYHIALISALLEQKLSAQATTALNHFKQAFPDANLPSSITEKLIAP